MLKIIRKEKYAAILYDDDLVLDCIHEECIKLFDYLLYLLEKEKKIVGAKPGEFLIDERIINDASST